MYIYTHIIIININKYVFHGRGFSKSHGCGPNWVPPPRNNSAPLGFKEARGATGAWPLAVTLQVYCPHHPGNS